MILMTVTSPVLLMLFFDLKKKVKNSTSDMKHSSSGSIQVSILSPKALFVC